MVKKSAVRAVRISTEVDQALQEVAAEKRSSVNAVAGNILLKYVERDRMMERNGVMSMTCSFLAALLGRIDESEIDSMARELSTEYMGELLLSWYGATNFETLLKFMVNGSRYNPNAFKMERKVNGRTQTLILHHEFGRKWSIFLARYWGNAIELVAHVRPNAEIGPSFAILNFPIAAAGAGGVAQPSLQKH